MKIEPQPKNYTINKEMMFFSEWEKVSLSDLEQYFTLEALALLIKNNYIVRDSTSIRPHE